MGVVQERFTGMKVDITSVVKGMFTAMVGWKYRTTKSVVLCVLVMMENIGLVLDIRVGLLRHLMMGDLAVLSVETETGVFRNV